MTSHDEDDDDVRRQFNFQMQSPIRAGLTFPISDADSATIQQIHNVVREFRHGVDLESFLSGDSLVKMETTEK